MQERLQKILSRAGIASRRAAEQVTAIRLDGDPVASPIGTLPSESELLSAELDNLARDRVYEAAVRATAS